MFKCPKFECNKEYNNIISLSKHWVRSHKEKTDILYLKLNGLTKQPTCACGCGEKTKFLDAGRGFSIYKWGHKARVKGENNFQKNDGFEKSIKTRREMFEKGELEIWNKGLTATEDKHVANNVAKMTESIRSNEEELKTRANRMREGRLDGTIPTLYGSEHSRWKGGVSSLNHTCRANRTLYKKWIRPHLIRAEFKCEKCGVQGRLQVHHNKETFSKIMRKIAKEHNWTLGLVEAVSFEDPKLDKLKKKIAKEVAEYHIRNNVSGIVLCSKCHKEEHTTI